MNVILLEEKLKKWVTLKTMLFALTFGVSPAGAYVVPQDDSNSNEWKSTSMPLSELANRRLPYTIVKVSQKSGNVGVRFKDHNGNSLPIYFQKSREHVIFTVVKKQEPEPVAPKPVAPKPTPPVTQCNTYTFDARSSYDKDKQELEYFWEFGDGHTSKEPLITHAYEEAGDYNVKLTVIDNSGLQCDTSTTMQQVRVNTAPQAMFSSLALACVNEEVTFDAGKTQDNTLETISYSWNFGDGSQGTGQKVKKTYSKGGRYTVMLKVDDKENTKCSVDVTKSTILINTPPIAKLGNDIFKCLTKQDEPFEIPFEGTRSKDADGDALVYAWDFGDGSRGQGGQTSHVYKAGGTYMAKLTVSDSSKSRCAVDSDTVNVDLKRTPLAEAGADKNVCLGQKVVFDGSASQADANDTLIYTWDFGDGLQATGVDPTHKFSKGGRYLVKLMVDNGHDSCNQHSDSLNVNVNSRPEVSLATVDTSCVGDTITFNASGSRDPDGDRLKFVWKFGDRTTVEGGSRVYHKYNKGGSYTVTVTVDDEKGYNCSKNSNSIRVKINSAPVSDAGPNLACCVNQQTQFDGSASYDPDGDKLTYSWNFGDSETSSETSPSHVFEQNGLFQVKLKVDDNSGTKCSSDISGFKASVNTKPVPIIKIK